MSTDRELRTRLTNIFTHYQVDAHNVWEEYEGGDGSEDDLFDKYEVAYDKATRKAIKALLTLLTEATHEAEIRGISKGKWYMLDEVVCEFSYPENTREKLYQMFRGWRRKAEGEMEQLQNPKNKEEGA